MSDGLPVILVADDEEPLRELIRLTLESEAVRVVVAADGEEALALARRERPAVVLLDWHMPGRSGPDVCRALRADPATAGTRVVMITARSRPADRDAALRAGVDDFLTKPFSPLTLLDTVASVLGPEVLLP